MLLSKPLNTGNLNGSIFDFEFANDILPGHIHDEGNVHITIVCKGKIKAYSHDWEIEAIPGQVIDFRVGEPHEIMALEDNTRIINIIKKFGGVSNDYNVVKE
jgi:quercetin dioxygenase-like cupin family protein